MTNIQKHFQDFDIYSRALIASRDVDPVYGFIKSTLEHFDFEPEWFCFAYTTFYSLESAMIFCRKFPWADKYKKEDFFDMRVKGIISKMGHERRGSQRNPANQNAMFEAFRGKCLYEKKLSFLNQIEFKKSLALNVPMHGPWATFKVAEVFEKVLGWTSLSIPDLGIDDKDSNSNDGPIGGLRHLYGLDNTYDKSIYPTWNNFGLELSKAWGVDLGEVESALCKWHKLVSGNYYIGHDIDELWELKDVWGKPFFEVMEENFAEDFVYIERHGVQKQLKKNYIDNGEIINEVYAELLPKADVYQILMDTE